MSLTNRSTLRRLAIVVAVLAVGGLALVQPARAVGPTGTDRIAGSDRYDTAAQVAADTFPDGAANAVLATGEDFADALAGSGLAGALDGPVLLTPTDRLIDVTEQALSDLGVETVYLMGGEAALSASVENALTDAEFAVERVSGDDRFGTAAAAAGVIAEQGNPITGGGIGGTEEHGVTAFLANGFQFPDAVSASAVSYAAHLPILLANDGTDRIPQATLDAISDQGIEHVALVGGTGVISTAARQNLEEDTGVSTERLGGADRWETNTQVVDFGVADFDFGGDTVYLSTGSDFADALVGGPAAGAERTGPDDEPLHYRLLLTDPDVVPGPTETYLQGDAGTIDDLVALGGTAAIADSTLSTAADLAVLDDYEVLDLTPDSDDTNTVSSSPLQDDGAREFTASGLDVNTEYTIAVLDAAAVGSQDGKVTVSEYRLAQGDSTAIEQVNGQQNSSGGTAGSGTEALQVAATPTDAGEIVFTVDATSADQVVPFVYIDEDGDGELDIILDEELPDEPFGRGGLTKWTAAAS